MASRALAFWRRGKPSPRSLGQPPDFRRSDGGMFVGGMLGNFFVPHRYISLEILDPVSRPAQLALAMADVCTVDAELREAFKNRAAFCSYAARADTEIVCMSDNACEYIAANWGPAAVRDYAHLTLEAIPNGLLLFRRHHAEALARPDAALSVFSRPAALARFFVAHGLDLD